LNLNSSGAGAPGFTVISTPAGINCTVAPDGANQTCTGDFEEGESVSLTTNPSVPLTWLGECSPNGGNPAISGSVTMAGARVCNATSNP
jgi:hypothetical protein